VPRLTAIKGEVGTSGLIAKVDLTSGPGVALADAVACEHYCTDEACDISAALSAGFPYSAAHLLVGATETPLLDAVVAHFDVDLDDPPDWSEWVSHFHEYGVECESCGAFTFGDDFWTPERCGNCLAPLPTPIEKEDR
jgi:dienelactone hydrolase